MKQRIIILFIILLPALVQGQTVDDYLGRIKSKLEILSDSLSPGLNEVTTLSFSGISIQSFLRTVAESHKLNFQVDPQLNINISNNFTNVVVKDVILFLCEEYALDIRFTNNILSFYKYTPPKVAEIIKTPKKAVINFDENQKLLSLDLNNDTLSVFLKKITVVTGKNVIASSDRISGKLISGFIQSAPLDVALEKIAFMNSLTLKKTSDDFYVFSENEAEGASSTPGVVRPTTRTFSDASVSESKFKMELKDSLLDIEAFNVPIIDIIREASVRIKNEYVITTTVTGSTSLKVSGITYHQLLSLLFQTTTFTFKKSNDVYVIGERVQEGLRSVEVVKLEFRTVEGIDKELPADLLKGVEIKIFKDLNSVILSGSTPLINEIRIFLKKLDQPVPNIMIEVLVVDFKKGFNIQTGIRAFLADSAANMPRSGGQVFPKLDLSLSSKAINNALSTLNSNGLVNLGRVTPQFYLTLQALEDNNLADIRSTPKLSTMNGYEANLTIGQSQYYLEQTQNITGGVSPITTVVPRYNKVEANLSITIKPIVSGNEHITLDIDAEFSDFVAPKILNAPPGNSSRKFKSKIRVKNEEMLLFGGLEEVSKSETSSGVPLLSRIPFLKWLFSSRGRSKSENRLMVFIKPTVVY